MHSLSGKRIFDLFAVLLSAPFWMPVLLLIGVVVRIKLGRPVFFRQKRPGYNEAIFELIKFRTMTDERDANGALLPDTARLPPFGRWLRSTSMDELPELLNILKGEMSLVGPRPLLVKYLNLYSAEQRRRQQVPPGLTGWVQVNGRNLLSWDEKFALDVWYVENRNLWLDLQILFRTIGHVFSRQGISAPGDATMPEYSLAPPPKSTETELHN